MRHPFLDNPRPRPTLTLSRRTPVGSGFVQEDSIYSPMSTHLLLVGATAVLLAGGCARPLDVKVIDASTRAPVAGARITRMGMKRPYFIVGAKVPKEQQLTNAEGIAHLKDRSEGPLWIEREGYEHGAANIYEYKAPSITVELKRLPGGG